METDDTMWMETEPDDGLEWSPVITNQSAKEEGKAEYSAETEDNLCNRKMELEVDHENNHEVSPEDDEHMDLEGSVRKYNQETIPVEPDNTSEDTDCCSVTKDIPNENSLKMPTTCSSISLSSQDQDHVGTEYIDHSLKALRNAEDTETPNRNIETEVRENKHLDDEKRSEVDIQNDGQGKIIMTEIKPESSGFPSCNRMDQETTDLTMVLIGNTAAVQFGSGNILLGQEHLPLEHADLSHIGPRICEVSGHRVSVIRMLDLHDAELSQESMDHYIGQLLSEKAIHAFIFVLSLGQLTDADQIGVEWLQRMFGESALAYVMILFTYENEQDCDTIIDDLKSNTVLDQLIQKCGGRYHTCNKSMNNQSEMKTLLEKIDLLVAENKQCCYTGEMYDQESRKKEHLKPDCEYQETQEKVRTISGNMMEHFDNKEAIAVESKEEDPGLGSTEEISKEMEERDNEQHKTAEIEDLMCRLNLKDKHQDKLTTADFLKISTSSIQPQEPMAERELAYTFLQRLLMMDYRARYIPIREERELDYTKAIVEDEDEEGNAFDALYNKKSVFDEVAIKQSHVHPMDVQMAVFHCADSLLRQYMVTKLSLCQYALPLLVHSPFTQEIEFPMWTFRQIRKSWKSTDDISNKVTSKNQPIYRTETPMVSFFRLGSVSSSKSQLMNSLINERHSTFFHRHCPGSSRTRLLMDGVVEIAWYCPSGKNTDVFTDCVAFCNLHGDAKANKKQLEILTEMASVNVVLLPGLDKNEDNRAIVQELFNSPKPLICLLTEDDSAVTKIRKGKYKMGLRDRNQSDVSEELRKTIKGSFSASSSMFKLEDVAKNSGIKVDEEDEDCQRGKEAALQIMKLLEGMELPKIKETFLPCQGKLWHEWSQKNKDLYRLTGNLEKQKSIIQQQMMEIRHQQQASASSELMMLFVESLNSLAVNEKMYFLKWVGILMDNFTSDELSAIHHVYDEKWSKVLALKKKHDKSQQFQTEQMELESISEELNAATFGLEHILREMGQMYEASVSLKRGKGEKANWSHLPELAAELMISGYPMELMDGDAAHVPFIWVNAVLDEVIKELGDQRVFVLSVLGIQSTGKSTMLNAMFGLQFAVSAGRCTRGAFMQLVRVTEEMKSELKFDYVLVVDTEGLRALELAGKATQHHDNELATFVIGLGNMTLINIFGENPAEMQDILQIAVQAFLRMKKVRLSPSCVFVHQNVGDITAGDKNMEGKRRLQDKLDEMTQLAAKEEVCDVECFSDVIAFDIQKDVKYFAQLWEGSPPMAPPNPCYSENVQELKNVILSKTNSSGMKLSQFKTSIQDLWNALLNENFVFSFKNTLEIAVYRKLEFQYGKWTWSLRHAMLSIEDKLHNRIENDELHTVKENGLVVKMKTTHEEVEKSMKQYFDEDRDKEILVQWRGRFEGKIHDLHSDLVKETKRKLDDVIQQKAARKKLDEKKTQYENKLFKKSKELALSLKNETSDDNALKKEFDSMWEVWVSDLTHGTPSAKDIDIWEDVTKILSESHEPSLVYEQQQQADYKKIDTLGNYSSYIILRKHREVFDADQHSEETNIKKDKEDGGVIRGLWNALKKNIGIKSPDSESEYLTSHDQNSIRDLTHDIIKQTEKMIQKKSTAKMGYNYSYIKEITDSVQNSVKTYESKCLKYMLKKEFTVDLSLHVCECAGSRFKELHRRFRNANDALVYLEKKKPQYYNVFKSCCSGASSTAVLGDIICSKLESSIEQAVYDKTAIDLAGEMTASFPAFSGNRSNLEKHILRSLAEEENFEKFITYIHNPRKHFKSFIRAEVKKYILTENNSIVLTRIQENIKYKQQRVIHAAHTATEEVKNNNGNANVWLSSFSNKLTDELKFSEKSCTDCREITDFDFLEEVVTKGLNTIISNLNKRFSSVSVLRMEMFRERPDEILQKHLCECCWVQCPFCNAICTNTMEGHPGDHSVPFHRTSGMNGWYYNGTTNLCISFCTTAVASNRHFYPSASDEKVPWKEYRTAGPMYADWSITPDNSELPYWKWFVCRFQSDLEKHYMKTFQRRGEIPSEWRKHTKKEAIESLEKYI